MVLQMLAWGVVAVVCVIVGKWVGQKLFGVKKDVSLLKRSAQSLAIELRAAGLRKLPSVLEEFVVGDVPDLLESIKEFATILKSGNEAIIKELDGTFERVLAVKLDSPEGRALIRAKLEAVEQVAVEVAKAAAPVVAAAAIEAAKVAAKAAVL